MSEKQCTKCQQSLPLSQFSRRTASKDGYETRCKKCLTVYFRGYYKNNHEKIKADAQCWAASHPESRQAYTQDYYAKNKSQIYAQHKIWKDANREKMLAYWKDRYWEDPEASRAKSRQYQKERQPEWSKEKARAKAREKYKILRRQVFEKLGVRCYCCGIEDIRFLTIDHIHNDGKLERTNPTGTAINSYTVLRRIWQAGCPSDRYRIACYNCNCARRVTGGGNCPHQEEE